MNKFVFVKRQKPFYQCHAYLHPQSHECPPEIARRLKSLTVWRNDTHLLQELRQQEAETHKSLREMKEQLRQAERRPR